MPAKTYHHGDLREALVKAGREILETEGEAALTLRACARKVGVSHAAPQHHFATVVDLLAEIAAMGFEEFVKALDAGAASALSPAARLKAMGQGYVTFAWTNSAVYRLMFSSRTAVRSERLFTAMTVAWEQLARCVSAAAGPEDVDAKAAHVWATVHGFATLTLEQRLPPQVSHYRALKLMLDGLPLAIGVRS
jgi:AcrR family transcriptional regulator